MKKKPKIRYLYGYDYGSGAKYVYFNYTKKKSISYYGWKRKDVKSYFGIDVKPKQVKKIRITVEEM